MSDGAAKRRFGSAQGALGKTLNVDGSPHEVVGVMPAGFSLLFQGGDIWIPLDLSLEEQARVNLRTLLVYGRLRRGAMLPQAQADLTSIQQDVATTVGNIYAATRVSAQPLREALFGNRRATMLVLAGAVTLVLLIAIINVANLTLADVLARRTLTMTRIALGASRTSIIAARLRELALIAAFAFATFYQERVSVLSWGLPLAGDLAGRLINESVAPNARNSLRLARRAVAAVW